MAVAIVNVIGYKGNIEWHTITVGQFVSDCIRLESKNLNRRVLVYYVPGVFKKQQVFKLIL